MININKAECVGCGLCIEQCPQKAIQLNEQGYAEIDQEKCVECGLCINLCSQKAIMKIDKELIFAIGTDNEKTLKSDDHVGASKYYMLYKYSNGEFTFLEKRTNPKFIEDETKIHGDPEKANKVKSVLNGVEVIVANIFGPNISRMRNNFVCVVSRKQNIGEALESAKQNINTIFKEKENNERKGVI